MTVTDGVVLSAVIDAIQDALVRAATDGSAAGWDEFEREAFAHEVATGFLGGQARRALGHGDVPLDAVTESELVGRALAAYFGAGKFQVLLDLAEVTDILINRFDAIYLRYVDGRKLRFAPVLFASDSELRDEVSRLARRGGGTERRFDDGHPLLVLRLADGARLAATMQVSRSVQVTIRRNLLTDVSLHELVELGTLDLALEAVLAAAVRAGFRIVFLGATGAGKTTLVRACVNETPPDTRFVVIEDTREHDLAGDPARADHVLEWEIREPNIEDKGHIGIREMLRHSLRFDPDWLIVGEVRDGDAAREMLLAMQHGHPSMSTMHHNDALTAWTKLAEYLGQGSERWEFSTAGRLVAGTVDLFVHVGFTSTGQRVVTEVVEPTGWDGEGVSLQRVFLPGPDGRAVPGVLSDRRRRRLLDHGLDPALLLNPNGWWR